MRIAFVSANRENMPDAVIPLGLLYVVAATPARHETVVWDLCFEDEPLAALARHLDAFGPDVVAIGMRNIQNHDYTGTADNLRYYRSLFATVRAHSAAPVVLGGGGFSVMPEALLRHLQPDFGIAGEGETAFVRLLEAIERGDGDFGTVPNLFRLVDGEVVATPPAPAFQVLDTLQVPDRRLVDARHYARYGIDSVQTKRGCALHCDYCTYPIIEGRSTRSRDPVRVVDEMFLSLERAPSIRHFFIVDSVFNLPPSHAKAVCRELIARRWQVPWSAYANPIAFDQELADLMVAAGCAGVEIGADSGVDAVLDRMRKGFRSEAITRMHAVCQRAGLRDCYTFILGTPGESIADACATLDFCTNLDPFAAILMVWLDDTEALDAALAAQRRQLREEIKSVVRQKAEEFPRWIIPPLGVNFDPVLLDMLRRSGRSGPLWQHIQLAGSDQRARRLKRTVEARSDRPAPAPSPHRG